MPRVTQSRRPLSRASSTYIPREQFLEFHNRRQRWATLVTHRRAGKTVALVNDVLLRAQVAAATQDFPPDPQYAYIGPTYKQSKRIAWNYLKRYSRPRWIAPPSESELKVTLKGNAVIYCLGADNADSLRGMYLDGFVGDEYAMWKPSVFSQILRPALSDRNGWGVFSSTPRGRNLFYDRFRLAVKDPERHYLLQLRADQSGIILPPELADLQLDMDPEEFAQEYLCSFDSALKGAIYASEINQVMLEGRIVPTALYDPHLDTHFVYDLGFTDSTICIAFQLPPLSDRVNIVGVRATAGVSIFEHIDWHLTFGGQTGQIWLPHDARAKSLQTGRSIVEQFVNVGLTPRIVPHHNVRDGIAATRKVFPKMWFDGAPLDPTDPMGDTTTSDLIEACKQYHREWDEDNLCFDDQPHHDWSSDYCDALRYMSVAVSPMLTSSRSSDNALQSARSKPVKSMGYDLATLFEEREALLANKRTMT